MAIMPSDENSDKNSETMRLRELPDWCVDPRLWRWHRGKRLRSSGPLPSLALCISSMWLFLSWILSNKSTITSIGLSLSTIARTWKQPRYPSTDEWIKRMWYIYIQWSITQP